MKIGAQLYTVRQHMQSLDDLAQTLERIADIGYTTVQVSAACPFAPEWLRGQLARTGLACVLTHAPADRLLADPAQVAVEHDVFGCRYVGLGYHAMGSEEDYGRFLADYRPVARTLREHGKYFMYHNHAGELAELSGRTVLARMADDLPAEDMGFTLDSYWIAMGGGDPVDWIRTLSGRIPCVHLKDRAADDRMAVVGEGTLPFDRILAAAEAAGTQYLLVEQDDCYGEDPFSCLARSYKNLHAMGLD